MPSDPERRRRDTAQPRAKPWVNADTIVGALKGRHRGGTVVQTILGGALFALLSTLASPALAHPEFQAFSKQHSGRGVNCAMCHANADGPDGLKPGQIGRLTPKELERLNKARAAFQPGADVDSPILNAFGNHIVNTLGKERLLTFRKNPAGLAAALGNTSDLDSDGISDAQEYLDGTHPLDAHSGAPGKLLLHNLRLNAMHVVLLGVAIAFALFGIRHLLRWLGIEARAALAMHEKGKKT